MTHYILLLNCLDRPGIVHDITSVLLDLNANIVHADQHSSDDEHGAFFIRIEFVLTQTDDTASEIAGMVAELEDQLTAHVRCFEKDQPLHCSVLASKEDHCLQELLYQWKSNELNIVIDSIISNHDQYQALADWYGIPFHYVASDAKHRAEERIMALTEGTDMLIMARYMQILSGEFLHQYKRPVVNIHHSFLPSFPGAKPYHQAYARGVKLIGATAHYATEDLDEGPIIVQKVAPVTHRDHIDDLKRMGRQLEKQCLVDAIRVIADHRVIIHEHKTIVF
ncbi:MAG: formyltetrahydrofolate deformylase [Candidatus Marinamargulisbacteria bacterium]